MLKITNKAIREYLGHNGGECLVRIGRHGAVYRYGSRDPFNRSRDYWMIIGSRDSIVREMSHTRRCS